MTAAERVLVERIVYALSRAEWGGASGNFCPLCGRQRAYRAHPCSCPVALAFKAAVTLGIDVKNLQPCEEAKADA